MSLKDDLGGKNSYYIVEIKALKRILTAAEQTGCPVLCFVDEVLRGTNTVERIAASSEILKYLKDKNVLCFAATHDIELTAILSGCYDNYHFRKKSRTAMFPLILSCLKDRRRQETRLSCLNDRL